MKSWIWILLCVAWLAFVLAGRWGFAIAIQPNLFFSPRSTVVVSSAVLHLFLFGWTVPLAIGIVTLARR